MSYGHQYLLVGAVTAVGLLHTLVPDHWLPIALLARQRGWSRIQTVRAALIAGSGHVMSTLLIGVMVWLVGSALAVRFGNALEKLSSLLLIAFGLWMAFSAWREQHGHAHTHHHHHDGEHTDHPPHDHSHETSRRTTLLLILGSSPMVEGIPAFFAAGKYGVSLITVMALCFAISTIATYVCLCVLFAAGLQRIQFGPLERYGEVLSGALIAAVGGAFMFSPV